jgi:hypothetical protein
MLPAMKFAPRLNEGQVAGETVNDSPVRSSQLTPCTDPKDDPEADIESDPSSGIED